jgi:hypothetical protein
MRYIRIVLNNAWEGSERKQFWFGSRCCPRKNALKKEGKCQETSG